MVASADLTSSQFSEFQDLASDDELAVLPAIPFIIIAGTKVLAITAASLGVIKAASNIQELLNGSDADIFVPEDVDTGTEPFDLGAATEIDPNTLPEGNDFLEDILNGQFEFPDAEEGGSYFLPIGEVPDSPIGKTTKLSKKFLEDRGVDAEDLKAGVVGDAGGQFDIYKDKKNNLWAVTKGDKAEESDLWLDNLDNY